MAMVGRRTESIYRRYAIAEEKMLREGAVKLSNLRRGVRGATIIPISKARGERKQQHFSHSREVNR
jgi:hypothetical protein